MVCTCDRHTPRYLGTHFEFKGGKQACPPTTTGKNWVHKKNTCRGPAQTLLLSQYCNQKQVFIQGWKGKEKLNGKMDRQTEDQMDREKEDKLFEQLKDQHEVIIQSVVAKRYFSSCQMITRDADEKYGSNWQKLVCHELPFPPDATDKLKERMWNEFAKQQARNVLNRRRQNTTTVMKKTFKGRQMFGQ